MPRVRGLPMGDVAPGASKIFRKNRPEHRQAMFRRYHLMNERLDNRNMRGSQAMDMGRNFIGEWTRLFLAFSVCLPLLVWSGRAAAQVEPNADAVAAFRTMIESYRKRPALGVTEKVTIELKQDDIESKGDEVEAKFLFGRDRSAVVQLRGYQCYLSNGELTAIHEGNEHAYYRGSDDGSPYYALFNAFMSMPFPHLAIYLGED